ncbi:MAG: phosphate ABC transporter ATP-binding protein [Betaproteobacteria bacterium HGW-Betaproteobacteria-18]|nr:MAG: phosphate ABC transporter ATP-binding protein [Betaproteobacteria bacterium HGW-Betaproteobacteria-18]
MGKDGHAFIGLHAERLLSEPVFALAAASVHFGQSARAVRALSKVTLQIHPGERVALVGANGCGKSTLLRLLHGLLSPTAGQVHCAPSQRQAMLFQKPHLMRLSVQANIALGLWLRGTVWGKAKAQALEALARVGLAELAQRSARQLSGGQQQRVAMARAWALNPHVLLLDEPTASLDPHAKREVEALIEEFANGPEAMTLIFASHNLGQVKRLASRVIYLEHGRVLADLPVQDFFSGPLLQQQYPAAHLFVKGELV